MTHQDLDHDCGYQPTVCAVSLFQKMGLEEDFAAAAEDSSNNVNKTLSDDELKEVET